MLEAAAIMKGEMKGRTGNSHSPHFGIRYLKQLQV